MKLMNKIFSLMTLILLAFSLNSCEDSPNVGYIKEVYVETFLRVDYPIENVVLSYTQPTSIAYNRTNALIKDANVKIIQDKDTFDLIFDNINNTGYFFPDTNKKIMPGLVYELLATLKDGKQITGTTKTPESITWVKEPRKDLYYPQDTLKLPGNDSLKIEWTASTTNSYYFIRVRNYDTVNYGKYLPVPSDERNRMVYNLFSQNAQDNSFYYKNQSYWALIANTRSNTVWLAFKWFGLHQVSAIAPDFNMLNWYVNLFFAQSSASEPLLNSVKGGIGVFGSYSQVDKDCFLYKNQK